MGWVFLSVYLGVAVFVVLLARVVVDPYGHWSNWRNWLTSVGMGLGWLPLFLWVVILLTWDEIRYRWRGPRGRY